MPLSKLPNLADFPSLFTYKKMKISVRCLGQWWAFSKCSEMCVWWWGWSTMTIVAMNWVPGGWISGSFWVIFKVWVTYGCQNKLHKLGGLEQQKLIISIAAEVKVSTGPGSLWILEGEDPSLPHPDSGGPRCSLACGNQAPMLPLFHMTFSLFLITSSSSCVCPPLCPTLPFL